MIRREYRANNEVSNIMRPGVPLSAANIQIVTEHSFVSSSQSFILS
jgi:hypothetical protein